MSIPKEPRQIMINLMYLVLTALLALNVSNEILNAFRTLSTSIDDSNKSIDARTAELYAAIKASEKEAGQAEKVRPFRERADEVVKKSDEMWKYLEEWKKKVIVAGGGYSKEEPNMPDKPDNIDATTTLLVEQKGGTELQKKITEMRQFLLSQLPTDSAAMSPVMPVKVVPAIKNHDHNPTGDWNIGNFEHMPTIAAIAMFSKFQNDVRSSEAMVIKRLAELAHAKDLKYDTVAAVAVPKTTYALQGDKIEATILLAAFNKSNQPTVAISQGGGEKKPAKNGVIEWSTTASGTGLQTVKGTITLETPEQGKLTRPWSFDYMVGTTGASLQLDKMNVMFVGVQNPVTVSAAGYSLEDVYLKLPPGGTATGGGGKYMVECTQPVASFPVDIMAHPKDKGAADVKIASMPVRVMLIPNPEAQLMGKNGGYMSASMFKAAIAPQAVLKDFYFDAKFQVIEFTVNILPKGGDYIPNLLCKGNPGARFSDNKQLVELQNRVKPGDRIFIEGIKAVGPDKRIRTLNPINLTLN